MVILKLFLLGLAILVVPFLLGNTILAVSNIKSSAKLGFIYGWLILLAWFEIITIFEVFFGRSLTELTCIYGGSVLLILVILCVLFFRNTGKNGNIRDFVYNLKPQKWNLYGFIAVALLIVQLTAAVFYVHMDSDDAYYIGTANSSLLTDTLFAVEPDTGFPYTSLPLRYAFSALMIFWAYLSKISGIHPLIITHSIIPVIFILISYFLWWEIGKCLFREEDKSWIFFLFINILNIFGNTSVYTQSSFLLFRIWQGKAMLPNIMLPALVLTFLGIYNKPKERRRWFLVLAIIIAACCSSSMAVPLGAVAVASGSCVLALRCRDWKMLLYGFGSCMPCLLIGISYLLIQ